MDANRRRHDPYAEFNFVIEFGDMKAGFSEVNGLPTEDDIEYRSKVEYAKTRKLPGKRNYTTLSLKRGYTNTKELWEWHKSVNAGNMPRLSGKITVFDSARRAPSVWTFGYAYPTKWEGPAFNPKATDVAIEELEIVVEGLELIAGDDDPKP